MGLCFLLQEWKEHQHVIHRRYSYVWNAEDFHNINPETTDSVLGKQNFYRAKEWQDHVGGAIEWCNNVHQMIL